MSQRSDVRRGATIVLAAAALAGCAFNSKPVASFGKATASLTESYRPLLKRPSGLCEEDALLKALFTDPKFDVRPMATPSGILKPCQGLQAEQQARAVVVEAVGAYGKQLALLAGADPGALTADIEAVAGKAKALKDKGGTATFNGDRIDALSKLVSIVVSMVRGHQARTLTREVIAQSQVPLQMLVTEMVVWTDGSVVPKLKTALAQHQAALDTGLVPASDWAALPDAKAAPGLLYATRMAQVDLLKKIAALQSELKSAEAFGAAAQALLKAHRDLGDAIDQASGEAQFQALQDFIDQVRGLRGAAEAL